MAAAGAGAAAAAAAAPDMHPFRTGTLVLDEAARGALAALAGVSVSEGDFGVYTAGLLAGLAGDVEAAAARPARDAALAGRLPPSAAGLALPTFTAVLVDFCRCNTPASAVEHALAEYGFKSSRAANVVAAYSARVEGVRSALAAASHALPRVTDLTWRLDYVVATSDGGKVGKALFVVQMHLVEVVGGLEVASTREFTATPSELDELRARVKDALRAASGLTPK